MKKTSGVGIAVVILAMVLGLSYLWTQVVLPMFSSTIIYSETSCITDKVTEDMDEYDIAKMYRDAGSTVQVEISITQGSIIGSGVVIASNGYETTSLTNNIKASKGSYIVTNYHVIEWVDTSAYSYSNFEVKIINEKQTTTAKDNEGTICDAEVLWFNKNLDVAILYTEDNFDYVKMADRWIDCSLAEKLDYEKIFSIGTPLSDSYLNRLTVGNVASNNSMSAEVVQDVYLSSSTWSRTSFLGASQKTVLFNYYEDCVDIALGITPGNSGGGCFDMNGNLIGLATYSSNYTQTNGNQMNGMVPIYPVVKVLDKIIANNEKNAGEKIYDFSAIGLIGVDAFEAYTVSALKEEESAPSYFFNEKVYSISYSDVFNFKYEGYCVISTDSKLSLARGTVINSCTLTKTTGEVYTSEIIDRNDMLFLLLKASAGDTLKVGYGTTSSKTITLA